MTMWRCGAQGCSGEGATGLPKLLGVWAGTPGLSARPGPLNAQLSARGSCRAEDVGHGIQKRPLLLQERNFRRLETA